VGIQKLRQSLRDRAPDHLMLGPANSECSPYEPFTAAVLLNSNEKWRRTAEEPNGLPSLDPQLICYSWMTGIPDVAFVVFVRKQQPEIQYLKTSISEEQRLEFGRLVGATIGQIEAAQFPSHSGIRFPQNGCLSCSHLGLCLDDQKLIDSSLIRTPGASNFAWLDELVD